MSGKRDSCMGEVDFFRTQVNLTYRGRGYYSSRWGQCVTALVIFFFFIGILMRLVEFFGDMDPIEYFSLRAQGQDEVIRLDEIGFTFAVEDLSPEEGSIHTY